jgi:hypothetical protein
MSRRKTTSEFIRDAIIIHGDKYDYSKVDYINYCTNVEIICKVEGHSSFFQIPGNHVSGKSGCPKCAIHRRVNVLRRGERAFIRNAKVIHGDKYDYSRVIYKDRYTDIEIICPKHGVFRQQPYCHLMGRGCKMCITERILSSMYHPYI